MSKTKNCQRCLRVRPRLTEDGVCRACAPELPALGLFPVLMLPSEWRAWPECPRSIPLDLIAAHEEQVRRNHQQGLQELADRGGLHPIELHAAMEDRPFPFGESTVRLRHAALLFLAALGRAAIGKNFAAAAHA